MRTDYLNTLAMSGLFKYIKKEDYEKAWIELNMVPQGYLNNQIIYRQDEAVSKVAIVHSGMVKSERLHADGSSSLTSMYSRGEIFAFEGAFSSKKTSPLHITAEGDAIVIFFYVQNIFTSSLNNELMEGLLELLANDDIKKLYRIEMLSKKGLRDRIMSYLYTLAAKAGSNTFELDMTREMLAQYLCVNRSALSNELNQMKREGVINFDKKIFTIPANK